MHRVRDHYGVATISRLLKIIGLFCQRALEQKSLSKKVKMTTVMMMIYASLRAKSQRLLSKFATREILLSFFIIYIYVYR